MVQEIQMNTFGKNLPEKRISAGAIQATVWKNEKKVNGADAEFQTISLQRSYKDKDGKWQHTTSLRVNDLPKAALVMQKAYEYIVLSNMEEV